MSDAQSKLLTLATAQRTATEYLDNHRPLVDNARWMGARLTDLTHNALLGVALKCVTDMEDMRRTHLLDLEGLRGTQ